MLTDLVWKLRCSTQVLMGSTPKNLRIYHLKQKVRTLLSNDGILEVRFSFSSFLT